MFKGNKQWLLAAALTLTISSVATADSSAADADVVPAQSSTSKVTDLIAKKGKASYFMEFMGPTYQSLDGKEGEGTALKMNHYATLGWKLSSKWSVTGTQSFSQHFRSSLDDDGNKQDNYVANDPYLTFTNSKITSSERYGTNLAAYLRFYAPVSRATVRSKGSSTDNSGGMIRNVWIPTKTFMDGALTLSGATDFRYRIAGATDAERAALNDGDTTHKDLLFMFNPSISYAINQKVEPYLEYATDYISYETSSGKFGKAAHYVSTGVNITPTKKLLVNPYVGWSGPKMRADGMELGVNAGYTFL